MVDRGHTAYFAAPASIASALSDRRVSYLAIDAALPRLDVEVAAMSARLHCDALVLVDAAAVDKVARVFKLSVERIASAAPRVVSLDCWNLVKPPPVWDYGAITEPLNTWLLEQTSVIRPVPIAPLATPGGYAALPALTIPSNEQRAQTRRRFGLPERGAVIVWPTARWQLSESHDNETIARTAARLEQILPPVFAALGDDVAIAHVTPSPMPGMNRTPGYRHMGQLPPADFEALVGAADALLCFNAAATSLATALSLDVPTALCTARAPAGQSLWAWPLGLDGILAPTVRDNPFYDTMSRLDPLNTDELIAGLRALLFDDTVREQHRAARASYREALAKLPDGADRLLETLDP